MTSTTLPSGLSHEVGEGFRPNDKELVNHFLKLKLLGYDQRVRKIPQLNIYKFEPWDLPHSGNPYWYFFCPRNNGRPSRTTEAGYWKATGRERMIKDANEVIGKKRSLVFYTGRNPRGTRTRWIMHEYCATFNLPNQNAFVLCKLMKKPDDKGSTQTCNMGDSDIENQKGNNSSFGKGETSCPITSTTTENLPDDGIPKEVHPELPTHPESLQPWNDQNYWLNSASEWPMQAEQGVYIYCEDDVFSGLEPLF
ncbi:hypothetical protein P3X46_005196 [Hevea brasiliensis]|uniref:NAC domain-containing protein n=1 Tax=Hevea brasiliensis TaxID=3981 RepID=A0ABQ9MZ53_HEVBR|nr:protein NTM1-like 9 isoform X2 [Hevea brasiliensis]KAJ9185584.1 hypothetical protein P3X46_005196 [Hevea brasiliensis]